MVEADRDLLLVDDDATLRGVLGRALERRGFRVHAAASGEEALLAARRRPPAFAVVDLKMEGMSGLALVRELTRLRRDMRIVVLTGYGSIATAVEAIKLGATHYLAKPAAPDEIVAALGREAGDPSLPVSAEPLSVDRLEWEHIQKVLAEHQGNISATARALKMHRRTLQRKLAKKPVPR
ncbi:MAG: response regulator transcription factor [Burkholderiales bacterium]|nr:response regulator transcription factor [Burkholderiales bacterium]